MTLTTSLLIDLLFISIGVARLSYLLVHEAGPYGIVQRFRFLVGVKLYTLNLEDERKRAKARHCEWKGHVWYAIPETEFARMLTCVYCTSLNVGIWAFLAYLLFPEIVIAALAPFVVGYFATKLGAIL